LLLRYDTTDGVLSNINVSDKMGYTLYEIFPMPGEVGKELQSIEEGILSVLNMATGHNHRPTFYT